MKILYLLLFGLTFSLMTFAQSREKVKSLPPAIKTATLLIEVETYNASEKKKQKVLEKVKQAYRLYPFKYIICSHDDIDSITAEGGTYYTLSASGYVSIGSLSTREILLREHKDYGEIYFIRFGSSVLMAADDMIRMARSLGR
ncbi:MAG: hypothetical protein IPI46_13660 [Bacteroidetes bacterium]|nr:hypothetical protein [Bacteroidota bacterium]